jgi:UDP-2,3-diacylglucosamine hydrolase
MPAITTPMPSCLNALLPSTRPTAALFVSDIHLQLEAVSTVEVFFDFLNHHGRNTQKLFLLGDIFEYWAGDDDIDAPLHGRVVSALRAISDAGVEIFWIAGNRDFLIGENFARATGLTRLPDPSIVTIAGQTIILTHGDAYCTDDIDYQTFRTQVRNEQWQLQFLAMPLAQRLEIIKKMREGSRMAQRSKTDAIMDVNAQAVSSAFAQFETHIMIHGHTHRPAIHDLTVDGQERRRYVLTDWDFEGDAKRGGALAINPDGSIVSILANEKVSATI